MKKRHLFYALSSDAKQIHIDVAESNMNYFCPFCRRQVIPKMGDKNIWHFAHKDEICEQLKKKSSDGLNDSVLDLSVMPTKSLDDIDLGDSSNDFLCMKCKKRFSKKSGILWKKGEYICRDCFALM